MQDLQLELFIAITDAGSFSKAEQNQYISKQAMMKQIANLEQEVGVPLFIRKRNGVELTEEGKMFYESAKHLLDEKNRLCMSLLKHAGKNYIRLGNVQHQVLLDPVTTLFRKKYPEIEIQRIVHPNHSGEYRVENNIQDIAEGFIGDIPVEELPYPFEPLVNYPYVVIMDENHPLAKQKEVSLFDVLPYQLSYFPLMVKETYRTQLSDLYQDHPEQLVELHDVDHQVEDVFSCVGTDHLILGANPFVRSLNGICLKPLKEGWSRTYGIVYQKNPSVTVKIYIETAKEYYSANH